MGIHRTTAMRRAKAAGFDHLLQSTKYIFGKAAGPMPSGRIENRHGDTFGTEDVWVESEIGLHRALAAYEAGRGGD